MKRFLFILALMAMPVLLHAQGNGVSMPWPPQFTNAAGTGPAALGWVCVYFAGTTSPMDTFSDASENTANPNPIRLNAAGRPAVSGTEVGIFIDQLRTADVLLYANGTNNDCNGQPVGSLIWSHLGISVLPQPNLQTTTLALVVNTDPPNPNSYSNTTLLYTDTNGKAKVCETTPSTTPGCVNLVGTGGSGSGSVGTIPVWTGTTTLGDSLITEDPHTNPDHVLKVNERLLVNGTATDVATGALVSLGAITEVNSPANARSIALYALGGSSGRAFVDSGHTGTGTTAPIALAIDGVEAVKISTEPFLQLTGSYTGGTLSSSGAVAIRNNNGVLEASQNGGAWAAIAAGGTVTASSSGAGFIPVFSTATDISSSMLKQIAGPFVELETSYTGGTLSAAGKVALRNNAGALEKSENGGAWVAVAAGGTVSGTTGTLSKFSSATAVGNSLLTESSSGTQRVNIQESLVVNGTNSDALGVATTISIGGIISVDAATNANTVWIYGDSTAAHLSSTHTGSGTTRPIHFDLDATEQARITTDGVLQLTKSYTGGNLSTAGTAALRNNAGTLQVSNNGGAWANVAGGGTVSGTTGTFAKFTGASAVGDSSYMSEDTGTAFVNIATAGLRVNGTTDDYGIGQLRSLGGLVVMNSASNAVVGSLFGFGGGAGKVALNSTHSGSGTTKPFVIQIDGTDYFKIRADGIVCMNNGGGTLRILQVSGSAWIDGGAC